MDYTNAANCSTSNAPSIKERGESLMIEEMECPTCHRKPTVRNGPYGKTYVVCEHTLAALKKHSKPADPPTWAPNGMRWAEALVRAAISHEDNWFDATDNTVRYYDNFEKSPEIIAKAIAFHTITYIVMESCR